MTGKHSGHTSVRKNDGGTPLRADEKTIASMLKPAGYATGGFGKWGCGGRGSTGVPEKHGFDIFYGYYDQVHAHTYYTDHLIRNSQRVPLDGKTYSHTIDTRTGKPVTHALASVTVVDEMAFRADALATALLVLGPEEGLALANNEGLAVLMLIRANGGFEERRSAAFTSLREIT